MPPSPKRRRPSGLNPHLREIGPIVGVIALAFAVLAGLAVLPARTWLSQREDMSDARLELVRIEGEVGALRSELEQLQTDEEIERLARRDFDLVFPGEESYRIVPAD